MLVSTSADLNCENSGASVHHQQKKRCTGNWELFFRIFRREARGPSIRPTGAIQEAAFRGIVPDDLTGWRDEMRGRADRQSVDRGAMTAHWQQLAAVATAARHLVDLAALANREGLEGLCDRNTRGLGTRTPTFTVGASVVSVEEHLDVNSAAVGQCPTLLPTDVLVPWTQR